MVMLGGLFYENVYAQPQTRSVAKKAQRLEDAKSALCYLQARIALKTLVGKKDKRHYTKFIASLGPVTSAKVQWEKQTVIIADAISMLRAKGTTDSKGKILTIASQKKF